MSCIYRTNRDWINNLRENEITENVNFFRRDTRNFNFDGQYFYFMDTTNQRYRIVGRGIYVSYTVQTIQDAWVNYEERNGYASFRDFYVAIGKMYRIRNYDENIGCIEVTNIEWLEERNFIFVTDDLYGRNAQGGRTNFSEAQERILNAPFAVQRNRDIVNLPHLRNERIINARIRNSHLVRRIKEIRQNRCQICDETLQIGINTYYSEVHHIQPLGRPYNGDDEMSNMICVCPNCHKKLDYAYIEINPQNIRNDQEHIINIELIHWHNERVINRLRDNDLN